MLEVEDARWTASARLTLRHLRNSSLQHLTRSYAHHARMPVPQMREHNHILGVWIFLSLRLYYSNTGVSTLTPSPSPSSSVVLGPAPCLVSALFRPPARRIVPIVAMPPFRPASLVHCLQTRIRSSRVHAICLFRVDAIRRRSSKRARRPSMARRRHAKACSIVTTSKRPGSTSCACAAMLVLLPP